MKLGRVLQAWALAACCAIGCGGAGFSDGGQSGTGLAAVRGNVVGIMGGSSDLANIRVSLVSAALATQTDADGRFELRGDAGGQDELRFERQSDGLIASTVVVIPAGGVLDLQQIVLDFDSGEARPGRQLVEFQGIIETLDCAGGAIVLVPKDDDPAATPFTVEVSSATIRHDGAVISCGNLRLGDQLQVRGETADGVNLLNAVLVLEEGDSDPGMVVEFQGIVETFDCGGGGIVLRSQDDDPQATLFTVEVVSATIRRGDETIRCGDLRVGDRFQVRGESTDGRTVVNARLLLEEGQQEEN